MAFSKYLVTYVSKQFYWTLHSHSRSQVCFDELFFLKNIESNLFPYSNSRFIHIALLKIIIVIFVSVKVSQVRFREKTLYYRIPSFENGFLHMYHRARSHLRPPQESAQTLPLSVSSVLFRLNFDK